MPIHNDTIKLDVFRDLYLNFELNQTQLSKIFDVYPRTVGRWLQKLGILRSRSEATILSWKHGTKKYNTIQKRGNKSPSWKGGRFKDSRGYIRIYKPDHYLAQNNGYVLEHRLVWFSKYFKTPKDYIIHHLNGIRNDNRPENLFAIQRKRHISNYPNTYIRELQKRIRELEMRDD